MMMPSVRCPGASALAAAIVYVGATAAGSLLDPTYPQVRQHVSVVTQADRPP